MYFKIINYKIKIATDENIIFAGKKYIEHFDIQNIYFYLHKTYIMTTTKNLKRNIIHTT